MLGASLTPERWVALEPLLDAALDVEGERRAELLDHACGSQVTLRVEVEALLRACERAEVLMATPAAIAYAPLLEGAAAPSLPALLDDRYHVLRPIGRGGMATVYLAEDRKHARRVAVKVLHAPVLRAIDRESFAREIAIAATLSHPYILPLLDSGSVGDTLFYVMPYVAGESLRDRLRRAPRPSPDAVRRLGQEVASALDYAHRQGVIHLDVKPGNILLQDGHAVVADFGIARAVSDGAGRLADHRARRPLGTPAYMSPEQAAGAHDLDGRSDVYSLGCVLYEMLAGAPPFADASIVSALGRARALTPPDPAPLHGRAPQGLAAVVTRAMAPSREDRFATAAELARALRATTCDTHP